jgi:hypothetical protein
MKSEAKKAYVTPHVEASLICNLLQCNVSESGGIAGHAADGNFHRSEEK